MFYFSEFKKKNKEECENFIYIYKYNIYNLYLKDNTFWSQRLRPLGHADSQRNKPNYYICYNTQHALRKIFISPIPRTSILAFVNCQLLVDSYEMEIDSAENLSWVLNLCF